MQSALDISKYVIYQYCRKGQHITNLKLQKILYYIQGYASRICNEPAFPQPIHNWPYGPVVPDVYYEYNNYHSNSIAEPENEVIEKALKLLKWDSVLLSVIDKVISKSYEYTASELVSMTHKEDPWRESSPSHMISYEQISRYFRTHDPLKLVEGR